VQLLAIDAVYGYISILSCSTGKMLLKAITHILLLISLLGQFLLTPAMALPDMLHTLSQQHSISFAPRSAPLSTVSNVSDVYDFKSNTATSNITFDCEALCQELASGHCTTHGGCSVGLHNDVISVSQNSLLHERIIVPTWSIKTVTLHIVNPPPIA